VLALAGCGGSTRAAAPLPLRGPVHTLRVALERVPWPLVSALARTRDETTLIRLLYSTPLRVDPRSGDIAPGLCTTWQAQDGGRVWYFRCAHAAAIAAQLRRVAGTPASPGRWMFRDARISSAGDVLSIRLTTPWLRFPYALTAAAAAPPEVRGPFRLVRARNSEIVARRGTLTVRFAQVAPSRAAVLFRRGLLDEAPVPLGDIQAALADGTIRPAVRVQQLLAVDALAFDPRGALARRPGLRRVYWQTADRADYQALVPEAKAGTAVSLIPGAGLDRVPASAYRAAKSRIPALPSLRLEIASPADPVLRYGSSLLIAAWRDLGLGARAAPPGGHGDALFVRLTPPYPQEEALLAQVAPQAALLGALNQTRALARADASLFARSEVIPVAWAVDARLVSPRVRGWSEDRLGDVDYARVKLR
jgi:hypothetical protein